MRDSVCVCVEQIWEGGRGTVGGLAQTNSSPFLAEWLINTISRLKCCGQRRPAGALDAEHEGGRSRHGPEKQL